MPGKKMNNPRLIYPEGGTPSQDIYGRDSLFFFFEFTLYTKLDRWDLTKLGKQSDLPGK
jgi:hypothetical protein